MDGYRLQILLFDLIRERVKDPKYWIDEIAGKLNLSKSAVYKKVNATSSLSLEELSDLLIIYDISFDQLIRPETPTINFTFPNLTNPIRSFLDFILPLKDLIEKYTSLPDSEVEYATQELPIFYWLLDRDLCYFKLYTFARTLWELEEYQKTPFSLNGYSGEAIIKREAIDSASAYFDIPSTEFWNENILNNTLNQIKYFVKSGLFSELQDALTICLGLKKMILHIREMAKAGKKFMPGTEPTKNHPEFRLFHNEIAHTNNTILVQSDTLEAVFSTYDSPNFIVSQDERLVDYTRTWFEKLKTYSQPVSKEAAKSRLFLFNQIIKKIDGTMSEIEFEISRQEH
jgi:transcriptional regulator with XRE-family HTH domain